MKNITQERLRKAIVITQSELENCLSKIWKKTITINLSEYEIEPCTEDDDYITDEDMCEALSEYFDVKVTSLHQVAIANDDIVRIWVVYEEPNNNPTGGER